MDLAVVDDASGVEHVLARPLERRHVAEDGAAVPGERAELPAGVHCDQ